jgi:hypothetical protein
MNMRITMLFSAGLALAFAASPARAQGPPGGPGGPNLLSAASVQEDLGLNEKQKGRLKQLDASMMQRRRDSFQMAGEGGLDPEAMRSTMDNLRREQEAAASKILDKTQKARLTQIELQREGVLAVARKEIAAKLKLTATQSKKIKAIVDEMQQTMARSMPRPPGDGFPGRPPGGGGAQNGEVGGGPPQGGGNPGGGPPQGRGGPPDFDNEEVRARFAKMREDGEKLRTAATKQVEEVLTKDQRVVFDKLLGKPFDFSTIRPGPGPGGRPRRDAAQPQQKRDAEQGYLLSMVSERLDSIPERRFSR